MVKIMETPIRMDDLEVKTPLFLVQHPFLLPFLKLTASSPLKMDGWNTFSFPFGEKGLFSGANLLASFQGL